VLRKEDNDWVKKCMEYEVEGARPRSRPKKTWREIVEKTGKFGFLRLTPYWATATAPKYVAMWPWVKCGLRICRPDLWTGSRVSCC